jgi:hypothetical protein
MVLCVIYLFDHLRPTSCLVESNKNYPRLKKLNLASFVILMYICSTIHAAVNWLWFSRGVDENELPGGSMLANSLRHIPPWLEATGNTFFALNILLADSLMVHFLLHGLHVMFSGLCILSRSGGVGLYGGVSCG